MATATVTLTDNDGDPIADAVVRLYSDNIARTHAGTATTDAAGVATLTVPDGDYLVHADPRDGLNPPGWANEELAGGLLPTIEGGSVYAAGAIAVRTLSADLISYLTSGVAFDQPVRYTFWKDTTGGGVLRLLPGEERTRVFQDRQDPIFHHVLVGPFLSAADAASA